MEKHTNISLYLKLFIISLASLFLEILVIRWISTEVRIFAYFKNLALIACFLGLGLGYATSARFRNFWGAMGFYIVLVIALKTPFLPENKQIFSQITKLLAFDDFFVWGTGSEKLQLGNLALGLSLLLVLIGIIVWIFIPIGRYLGQLFEQSPNRILAYSVNVFGSLIGIWLFSVLSYNSVPPPYWLAIGLLLLLPAVLHDRRQIAGILVSTVIVFLCASGFTDPKPTIMNTGSNIVAISQPGEQVIWSPYQKLTFKSFVLSSNSSDKNPEFSMIEVNNTFYLFLFNLSREYTNAFPEYFPADDQTLSFDYYNIPYHFHKNPKDILVVGAGGGNDVAGALRNSEARIDAVEIDPKIFALGKKYHPEKPYSSPRVNGIVDDARSYFKKTVKKYDMIIFGLLDSHTLASNFSNVSLDNYVYTYESFLDAKRHLKPEGIIVLSFGFKGWIGKRIAQSLRQAYGYWPISFNCFNPVHRGTGGVVFLSGNQETLANALRTDARLNEYVSKNYKQYKSDIQPTTDDWPYLWIKEKGIPTLHQIVLTILALVSLVGGGIAFRKKRKIDGQFFFLGAAFMLLEVHMISKLMLLFGSTWIVNTFVISGVLIMILGANAYITKIKAQKLHWYYVALFISLIFVFLMPLDRLFFSNYLVRGILTGFLFTFPLFFAGVIFAASFKKTDTPSVALASNLLGAILGGLSEVLSFIIGIRSLTLVALFLYVLAFLFFMKRNGRFKSISPVKQ